MTGGRVELVRRGVHVLARSSCWWGVGVAAYVVLNAAFWPSLRDSDTLRGLEDMGSLLDAFGAQNIATPAGYLDGQVFSLMLPLLLSAMAIAQCSALTSGDEDAGRLELLQALPVGRRTVWLARWTSFVLLLAAVSVGVAVSTIASVEVFSFDGVGVVRVVAAILACVLLAAFHAAVAFAAGGWGWSRPRAAGVAVLVLVAGYAVNFVLPLASSLAGAQRWSPWYWAIGEQPVSNGIRPGWLAVLVAATVALVCIGTWSVDRRDIRSA